MRRVDEKARDDTVPFFRLRTEDIHELSSCHGKVEVLRILHLEDRADVRHFDFYECILILLQVVEVVQIGIQCELVDLLRLVQYEI